jgi:hypothetical protein
MTTSLTARLDALLGLGPVGRRTGVGARGLPSTFDRPFGLRERQSRFIQKGLPCGCQLQWTSTPFDEPRTLCGALDSMPARYVKKACNALASRSLHVDFSRD